jgi:hypothetical protein
LQDVYRNLQANSTNLLLLSITRKLSIIMKILGMLGVLIKIKRM